VNVRFLITVVNWHFLICKNQWGSKSC